MSRDDIRRYFVSIRGNVNRARHSDKMLESVNRGSGETYRRAKPWFDLWYGRQHGPYGVKAMSSSESRESLFV